MSRWSDQKLVEAAVFSAKPERTKTVLGDALDRSATETIRIPGVMKVTGTAFGCRVEFVHAGVGGDPKIAVIVLHQILNKIGAQGPAINRIVFVYDEGVAVVAIEAVPGGKPHEAAMILQNSNYVALRQAILGGEVSEFEVPHSRIPIGRLRHGVDIAKGKPFADVPRGVGVLADIQGWIERKKTRAAPQQNTNSNCGGERYDSSHGGPRC